MLKKTIFVLACLFIDYAAAATTVPKLSGAYVYSYHKTCQATVNDTIGFGSGAASIVPGDIRAWAGRVTFKPNKTGGAGRAVLSGTKIGGGTNLVAIYGNGLGSEQRGNTLSISKKSTTASYSNTATTLKIDNDQYYVYYGGIDANQVAHHVTIINLVDDDGGYEILSSNKCAVQGLFIRD